MATKSEILEEVKSLRKEIQQLREAIILLASPPKPTPPYFPEPFYDNRWYTTCKS